MHLQITGRLDPGETYALIDLDVGNILPKGQSVKLDLVNIIICNQEGHSHFEPEQKADYPKDPNRYPETITVKRPRPRPLTFRRRTRLHVARLDPPLHHQQPQEEDVVEEEEVQPVAQEPEVVVADDNDDEEEGAVQERERRAAPDGGEAAAAAADAAAQHEQQVIGDLEFLYTAVFRESIFEFEVLSFPKMSLDTLVNLVLQGRQSSACFAHFQRLLHHAPVYELYDSDNSEEEHRQRKKKVRIILPPLTRLLCSSRHFFTYLGMAGLVEQIDDKQLFGLVNTSDTESKIFQSQVSQQTALKFVFYDRHLRPDEKYVLFFQRLDPVVSSKVTLRRFCDKNAIATAKLFSLVLECIIEALSLPHGSLKAFLYDEEEKNLLILDKADGRLHNDDSYNNFTTSFKFGARLTELLGLTDGPELTWKLTPGRPAEIKLEKNSEAPPEDLQACEKIIADLKYDMLNQTSAHPAVKLWKERWNQYITTGRHTDDGIEGEDAGIQTPGQGRVLIHSDVNPDDEDDDFDEFMIVQVPNPNPRPPVSYTVTNTERKHICTAPNIFPEFCTLLLKEGEPTDYLKSRGLCSVLGMVRKLQPNIVSNASCVLKNGQSLKSLSVEFVDESENTFKVPLNSQPIWIKLDIQCHGTTSY